MSPSIRLITVATAVFALGCGSSLARSTDAGRDTQPACAASGASCAASGCCASPSDSCLAQGNDRLCLNSIPPPTDGATCDGPASSDLPGVSLTFPSAPCAFTLAQVAAGITIAYDETIASPVGGVHPVQGDAGGCQAPDDAGLIVSYQIAGGGQSYCICDQGLCAPASFATDLAVGTHARSIPWDGRNWNGPSDTGNAEGLPFPAGTYTLTLTAKGTRAVASGDASATTAFTVTATRFLTITP
jgi:hypothetical protein